MEKIERRASVMAIKEIAYNACLHTSFTPDKRGEDLMDSLELELRSFLNIIPVEMHEEYEKRYIELYRSWLVAKGRCISSMITGPANFPTKRAEKYSNWERSSREKLDKWAQQVVERLNKPKTERLTGWEEVERLKNKIECLETYQENMKAANAIMRKKSLTDEDKIEELSSIGFEDNLIDEIFIDFTEFGVPFGKCQLTNNLAKITATKDRLSRLEKNANTEDRRTVFEWGTIELCYSEERIRLRFNERVDCDMVDKLKKNAFKWSPKNQAWQRQITPNAIYATKRLFGINTI